MKRPWCVHTLGDMIGPPYRNAILPVYSERDAIRVVSVRHVPPPYRHSRVKAAWFVLIGVAIAVEWPKPGDLEVALLPERLTAPPDPLPWDAGCNRSYEPVEKCAKEIFDGFTYDGPGEKPEWVPHGNSLKQDDARMQARKYLRADENGRIR